MGNNNSYNPTGSGQTGTPAYGWTPGGGAGGGLIGGGMNGSTSPGMPHYWYPPQNSPYQPITPQQTGGWPWPPWWNNDAWKQGINTALGGQPGKHGGSGVGGGGGGVAGGNMDEIFGQGWRKEQSKLTASNPSAAAALTTLPYGAADDWLRTMGVRRIANATLPDGRVIHNWQNWGPTGIDAAMKEKGWNFSKGVGWTRSSPYQMPGSNTGGTTTPPGTSPTTPGTSPTQPAQQPPWWNPYIGTMSPEWRAQQEASMAGMGFSPEQMGTMLDQTWGMNRMGWQPIPGQAPMMPGYGLYG